MKNFLGIRNSQKKRGGLFLPAAFALALVLSCMVVPPKVADAAGPAETGSHVPTQVKAAYIYNFSIFVEWPEGAFVSAAEPINVCVLGDDQMADALDSALKDRSAKGRRFVVKSSKWPQDLEECKIVFVGAAFSTTREKTMRQFADSGALVVADAPGAAERGAIINFFQDGERIRFEVNLAAARSKNFSMSSRMLKLARIVGQGEGEK